MRETLICSLEKHYIYLIDNVTYSYYIAIPYKEFKNTNLAITLRGDYENFNISSKGLDVVVSYINNLYRNIDNYNVTLVFPIFVDNTLKAVDQNININNFARLDQMMGAIINDANNTLIRHNVQVLDTVYIINNGEYKAFLNWFVERYQERVEYRSLPELMQAENIDKTYNIIDTPSISFVVGKNNEESIEVKQDNVEKIPDAISDIIERNQEQKEPIQTSNSYGYASYWFLGIITIVISFILLSILVR